MSDSEVEEQSADISSPDVTTKYTTSAEIANNALQLVMEACVDGADVFEVCLLGDTYIEEQTGKLYNKKPKKTEKNDDDKKQRICKGVAFPTCISLNEIVGHYSPLKNESMKMKNGDVCKVDLAVHIDGFIASVAHTMIVGGELVTDRRADVIKAAYTAAEAAVRTIQIGSKNSDVTKVIQAAAKEFNCEPVQGVLSHQMKKDIIDGNQVIINKEIPGEEMVDPFEFRLHEVYGIDIVMSSGEGKSREAENARATVYKRAVETQYLLKTKKARQFFGEVNKKYPMLPFTLRAISDEQIAKVGVSESKRHHLVNEYPVLKERDGEFVAQFKFTVLLLPSGTKRITGGIPISDEQVKSQCVVKDEELLAVLAKPLGKKKKKNKKKEEEPAEV